MELERSISFHRSFLMEWYSESCVVSLMGLRIYCERVFFLIEETRHFYRTISTPILDWWSLSLVSKSQDGFPTSMLLTSELSVVRNLLTLRYPASQPSLFYLQTFSRIGGNRTQVWYRMCALTVWATLARRRVNSEETTDFWWKTKISSKPALHFQ